jgi:hypothetical protein
MTLAREVGSTDAKPTVPDVARIDLMQALARFAPGDVDAQRLHAFMVHAQEFMSRRQHSALVDLAMQVALAKRWIVGERRE